MRQQKNTIEKSLNPCFSGGWSRRVKKTERRNHLYNALILVLVEDGLGGSEQFVCEKNA